jgi:hypothetical protein
MDRRLSRAVAAVRANLTIGMPRSRAWAPLEPVLRGVPSVDRLLKAHTALLRRFEALRHTPVPPNRVAGRFRPVRSKNAGGVCRLCREPLPHGPGDRYTPGSHTRHMWLWSHRNAVRRHWAKHYADPAKRRARMENAWKARRAPKDTALLETIHPRIRELTGDGTLLRRLGRISPASVQPADDAPRADRDDTIPVP